jgi:hypothetical protein
LKDEAAACRFDVGETTGERAQTADLDSQARPMRLVGTPRAECTRDQRFAVYLSRPRFREGTQQREQHRPARKGEPHRAGTQTSAATVDDEDVRSHERCDLIEAQHVLDAVSNAPRGGTIECSLRLRHLRQQRRHACTTRGLVRTHERCLRRDCAQRTQRELGCGQLRYRRQQWRCGTEIEPRQRQRSVIEPPEQQEPAGHDQMRL